MALTKKDLGQIKELFTENNKVIRKEIQDNNATLLGAMFEYVDKKVAPLATKEDIKHLPTKDDFYNKMDEVVGELKKSREESEILRSKVYLTQN